MPNYQYRARDESGQAIAGVVEAPNAELAQQALSAKRLSVVSFEEIRPPSFLERDLPFLNRVKTKDIVVFARQFAVLIGANVTVVHALRAVIKQTGNRRFKQIMVDIANEVEAGTPLSLAMSGYPKAFSPFFVNMIRSGETTGKLEEVMNYLADQMERDYDLNSKIRGAMIYPIFVISGLMVVGFVMMVFVIPKFTEILTQSGAELPWTTKALVAVSGFMSKYAIFVVLAVVLAVVLFRLALRNADFRAKFNSIMFRFPVFGPLLSRIATVRFTRSLATMIVGGVDVPGALSICADVVNNEAFRREILETKKEVMDGNSIVTVFEKSSIMPGMVAQMLAVGEETGRMSEVLERLTDFYSRDLQNRVNNLVSVIEPFIMVIMGVGVGVMVAAVILPMYNLAAQF